MNARLILNPGSRHGRGRRLWTLWREGLSRAGMAVEAVETQSLDHARRAALAAPPGCDTVVAVGGDGTINAVLTGIVEAGRPDLRMGVLYAGTSPDFCRFHGIPTDPSASLDNLLHGIVRPVDIARVVCAEGPGRAPVTRCFACSASVGMGAAVAARANRWRRRCGDTLGTALAVLTAIAGARRLRLDLGLDGCALPTLTDVYHLMVVKNPWVASGLRLDLPRTPDDGALSIVAITARSRASLLRRLPGFYTGALVRAPGVTVRTAASVRLSAPGDADLEFDGDPQGALPADIVLLPRALPLIIPP